MKEAAVERGCLHPTTSKIGCLAVLLADRVLLADKTPPFAFGSHHLSKKLILTYASHRRKSFNQSPSLNPRSGRERTSG